MSKTGLEEGVWSVARLVIRLEEQHVLVQHLSIGHVVALFYYSSSVVGIQRVGRSPSCTPSQRNKICFHWLTNS
jgi:hypothetical protein